MALKQLSTKKMQSAGSMGPLRSSRATRATKANPESVDALGATWLSVPAMLCSPRGGSKAQGQRIIARSSKSSSTASMVQNPLFEDNPAAAPQDAAGAAVPAATSPQAPKRPSVFAAAVVMDAGMAGNGPSTDALTSFLPLPPKVQPAAASPAVKTSPWKVGQLPKLQVPSQVAANLAKVALVSLTAVQSLAVAGAVVGHAATARAAAAQAEGAQAFSREALAQIPSLDLPRKAISRRARAAAGATAAAAVTSNSSEYGHLLSKYFPTSMEQLMLPPLAELAARALATSRSPLAAKPAAASGGATTAAAFLAQAVFGLASAFLGWVGTWGKKDKIKWEREAGKKAQAQAVVDKQFAAITSPDPTAPKRPISAGSGTALMARALPFRAASGAAGAAQATGTRGRVVVAGRVSPPPRTGPSMLTPALREKVAAAVSGDKWWLPLSAAQVSRQQQELLEARRSASAAAAAASAPATAAAIAKAVDKLAAVQPRPTTRSRPTSSAPAVTPSKVSAAEAAALKLADPSTYEPLLITQAKAGHEAFEEGVQAFRRLAQPSAEGLRRKHAPVFTLLAASCQVAGAIKVPAWRTMYLPASAELMSEARLQVPLLLEDLQATSDFRPLYQVLAGHDVNQVLGTLAALTEHVYMPAITEKEKVGA